MRHLYQLLVLSMVCGAAALSGCSESGSSELTTPSMAVGPRAQLRAGAQQGTAGMVFLTLDDGVGGTFRERYSFSAVSHSDGRVSGHFELATEQNVGERFGGTITCLRIANINGQNVAHLAGITTHASGPNFAKGDRWIWRVVDGGQGGSASADQASDFVFAFPDEVEGFCAGTFESPFTGFLEIDRGHIIVRP